MNGDDVRARLADVLRLDYEAWTDRAVCTKAPQQWFFTPTLVTEEPCRRGPKKGGDPYLKGRMLCSVCPVRWDCLDYAIRMDEAHGLWGGFDPCERKRITQGQDPHVRIGRRPKVHA